MPLVGEVYLASGLQVEALAQLLARTEATVSNIEAALASARAVLAQAEASVTARIGAVLTVAELIRARFQDPALQATPAAMAGKFLEARLTFETAS